MRTRVFLNPSETSLTGKYQGDEEHIHVVCDTTIASFTVLLPDLTQQKEKEFVFYNIPASGDGSNTVTIQCIQGQLIDNKYSSHVINVGDTITIVSNMKGSWLLCDVNNSNYTGVVPLGTGQSLNIVKGIIISVDMTSM